MRTRICKPGPACRLAIVLVLGTLAGVTGCQPSAPSGPSIVPPPYESPGGSGSTDPLAIRLTETRREDLVELLEVLGVEFHSWRYDGPACALQFWVEVQDDRQGGPPQTAAEGRFDLVGPDARIHFVLIPPSGPDEPPSVIFGTESWGEKSTTRATLPSLWHNEMNERNLKVLPLTDPVSLETARGLLLLSIVSDRKPDEAETTQPPRPERISLDFRVSLLPADGGDS